MMRIVTVLAMASLAQAALKTTPVVPAKVVQLSAEQQKTMHFGCVNACKPSPVESKCVTACEAAMYKCIDETGPNENEKDTKKCQDKSLKHYEETKGVEKKEEKKEEKKGEKAEGKKEEKKAEKKAKAFLQVSEIDDEEEDAADSDSDIDMDDTEELDEDDAQIVNGDEDTVDSDEEDSEEEQDSEEEEESFIQKSRNIDDENAEAAEMAKMEDNIDKLEGEDETADSAAAGSDEEQSESDDDEESFIQTGKNIDDENAEAAEMAKMEDNIDKLEGEDETADSAAAGSDEEQSESDEDEESFIQTKAQWKPEPCGELEPGVPCTHLYEHPQGSTVVMPCPVEQQTAPESCRGLFGEKGDGEQCPQITCPKALGVTMKLVCAGGCCPTCWAPDHVVKLDRHTTVDDAAVVDPAPQAPTTCGGVKCFKLACAAGFTEGFVNGDCCYSCIQGR